MSQPPSQQPQDDAIRAVYEEYSLKTGRVAMISDPENEYAWIQSDHTVPVVA